MSAGTMYRDQIGQRLDHPEEVPEQYQHLIPDDRARVEWILSHQPSTPVLDIGCSDGSISKRIADRWGVPVLAMDTHAGWLAKDVARSGVSYLQWDVRNSNLLYHHPEPFRTIYCCEVLEHLVEEDAAQAIKNMASWLAPRGKLIVTVPNCQVALCYEAGCRDRWKWPDHRMAWDPEKIADLFGDAELLIDLQELYPEDQDNDGIWLCGVATSRRLS